MMDVTEILGEGGLVADKLPGYEVRPQQIEMGEALMASPVVSDGILILRGRNTLFAISRS